MSGPVEVKLTVAARRAFDDALLYRAPVVHRGLVQLFKAIKERHPDDWMLTTLVERVHDSSEDLAAAASRAYFQLFGDDLKASTPRQVGGPFLFAGHQCRGPLTDQERSRLVPEGLEHAEILDGQIVPVIRTKAGTRTRRVPR